MAVRGTVGLPCVDLADFADAAGADRPCPLPLLLPAQLQLELRTVAGRDALRQALLAMVPQIDELQKKREMIKRQQTQTGMVPHGQPPSVQGPPGHRLPDQRQGSQTAPSQLQPGQMPSLPTNTVPPSLQQQRALPTVPGATAAQQHAQQLLLKQQLLKHQQAKAQRTPQQHMASLTGPPMPGSKLDEALNRQVLSLGADALGSKPVLGAPGVQLAAPFPRRAGLRCPRSPAHAIHSP